MNAFIDSVFLAVADLDAACRPYERLGLTLEPLAAGHRSLCVGAGKQRFSIHFLNASPWPVLDVPLKAALAAQRGLFALGLRTPNPLDLAGELGEREVPVVLADPPTGPVYLPIADQAGVDLVLLPQTPGVAPEHAFGLRRLDHLAVIAHDLDAKTEFWTEVLGVPVVEEIRTTAEFGLVIRQLKLGTAVLELLGPASADSPVHKRPAGLLSMASWEVADLEAAIAQARNAGFQVPDAKPGPLPGTRISTIAGAELSGVNMQLLQVV